jgi:hypothetical protein
MGNYSDHTVTKLNAIANSYRSEIFGSITDVLSSIKNTGAGVGDVKVEVVPGSNDNSPQIQVYLDDYLIILDGKTKPQWTKLPQVKKLIEWARTKKSTDAEAKKLAWAVAWNQKKYDAWKPKRWRKKSLSAVLKEMNIKIVEEYDAAIEEDLQQAIIV